MSDRFKDHFSKQSSDYASARPGYPEALFFQLASLSPSVSCAWDCGTGNGQAAISLADHFTRVVATDPSEKQIKLAKVHPGVRYAVATGEQSCVASRTVDLTVVAQALHWFDTESFYREVRRVTKPRGLIAVWCYQLFRICPELDEIMDEFYVDTVGRFWPRERTHVDAGYTSLDFPFDRVIVPAPAMVDRLELDQVAQYIRSWSATQRFIDSTGTDPIPPLVERMVQAWGGHDKRQVVWPLILLVGTVG